MSRLTRAQKVQVKAVVNQWEAVAPGFLYKEAGGDAFWLERVAQAPELWSLPPEPGRVRAPTTYLSTEADKYIAEGKDLGLRKYRGTVAKVRAASPELALGWGFYIHCLRHSGSNEALALIRRLDVYERMCLSNWKEHASWLSTVGKKVGSHAYLCIAELATLAGYEHELSDDEVLEDIRDWFGTRKHRGPADNTAWLGSMRLKTSKLVRDRIGVKGWNESITMDEYARNPVLWGTTGSVLYDKSGLISKGLHDAKKTKWAAAASVEPEIVLQSLNTHKAQYAKVIQKRETKKSRLVIASNLELYWKQDFCSESCLDYLFSGSTLSTLWMSSRQTGEFWQSLLTPKKGVGMPLDQSKFDHEQSLEMIMAVLAGVRDTCALYASADWLRVFDLAIKDMRRGYVAYKGKKIPIVNGIPSGWRWTAWLDTLLNWVVFELAVSETKVSVTSQTFQGDDVIATFATVHDAAVLRAKIEEWGFLVNPHKFFVSCSGRNEFLRRHSSPGRVAGYPARSINALLWRNPLNNPIAPGPDRMADMLDQWGLLQARLAGRGLTDLALSDIARANEMSDTTVRDWFNTPVAYGGGTLFTDSRKGVIISASVPKDTHSVPILPGVSSTYEQVALITPSVSMGEVRRWWSTLIEWKDKSFSRAGLTKVSLAGPIRLASQVTIPPVDISSKLARTYYTGIQEVAEALTPKTYLPNFSRKLRYKAGAGIPLWSTHAPPGVDSTWLATRFDNLFRKANGALYHLRSVTDEIVRRVQLSLDNAYAGYVGPLVIR